VDAAGDFVQPKLPVGFAAFGPTASFSGATAAAFEDAIDGGSSAEVDVLLLGFVEGCSAL